ncbi:MAG: folate-binding protein YgfZ [Gammaproteobacteria bacterium]|nr:folate-binding protein YgfZ [Gammaproteobacteria bacterium]
MNPTQNTLFDLPNLSILKILGDNAAAFLQGQLSCDVEAVSPQQMRQSAFCNLKGRVLALPDVLKFNDILHLILPTNLLEKTTRSLSKTAALSRVTLESDTNYHILGFYLKDINQPLPIKGAWPTEKQAIISTEDSCAYHLGDGFYIVLVHSHHLDAIKTPFIKQNIFEDQHAWHALRLAHHEIHIYPESRGLFLPHRLGLHTSGHLNFDKGCYRGQEIIARTHYRAKLKHTLKIFIIETSEKLQPGLRIMTEDNTREIGELIDFCALKNNQYLIAASILLEHPSVTCFETHNTSVQLQPMMAYSSLA